MKNTYTVEMNEEEYRLFLKVSAVHNAKKKTREENVNRSKVLRENILKRLDEYENIERKQTVYTYVRSLMGIRCNVKTNASTGITQREYDSMMKVLDDILPSPKGENS